MVKAVSCPICYNPIIIPDVVTRHLAVSHGITLITGEQLGMDGSGLSPAREESNDRNNQHPDRSQGRSPEDPRSPRLDWDRLVIRHMGPTS